RPLLRRYLDERAPAAEDEGGVGASCCTKLALREQAIYLPPATVAQPCPGKLRNMPRPPMTVRAGSEHGALVPQPSKHVRPCMRRCDTAPGCGRPTPPSRRDRHRGRLEVPMQEA